MNEFIEKMAERARQTPKKVGFPEALNPDVLKTAAMCVSAGIGMPVLIGNDAQIRQTAAEAGISLEGCRIFDNTDPALLAETAGEYLKAFPDFSEKTALRKLKKPLTCAMMLLRLGTVDCVAAGKDYPTGDVVFEAIGIVGLQPGVENPSSLGIADIPGFTLGENGMLALADCAITAQPDAKDLAGIAIASADTVRTLLGWEPRVAMLAFSTCGSAEHESVEVVRQAVELAKKLRPELKIDGEVQLDAAILPQTARKKVKRESSVAGKANVLIFPNLHAGNIGVKLIQIFGHANAYGPVLQGFAKPACDFSRSAPVEEMLGNVAMLVIRAGSEEREGI